MQEFRVKIGQEDLIIQVGQLARQANGAVLARYGDSVVLATVCCGEAKEGLDFVPLSVDYNERYYAAGKIPGGFLKREARPKDKEILVSRLIDRPLRPLFYKSFGREIQLIPMTIATDQINQPDIIGMMASFAAVAVSDIPFNGPVAALRIADIDGQLVVNPSFKQSEQAQLEIVVAANSQGICMVEGGAAEVSEERMIEALELADRELKMLCDFLQQISDACGKTKLPIPEEEQPLQNKQEILDFVTPLFNEACFLTEKEQRSTAVKAVLAQAEEKFTTDEATEEDKRQLHKLCQQAQSDVVRKSILQQDRRCDGRSHSEIRPISCSVKFLPQVHGSSLFTRGETQSLAVATLGSGTDEQIMDDIDGDVRKKFMLHYNFPPYSVGETGRLGTGRREIGHGHLAQRALEAVLPQPEQFPYTIRLVSEILESNGSSSMATVCSGSLALMDAGVPVSGQVAGVAMGLIKEDQQYAILSDILGEEDHLGDMDFKVAGTAKGITAFQMDIKIAGLDLNIISKALQQAKNGRLHILGIMNETLEKPKLAVSSNAPSFLKYQVEVDKIGGIIGPGGKNIREICEKCDAKIDIDSNGQVLIFSRSSNGAQKSLAMIKAMVTDPEIGSIYTGTVKRIMDFGAFIEFLPGREGLCHISKIAKERVQRVEDILKEGQQVEVKLTEIDRVGRYNLSMVFD